MSSERYIRQRANGTWEARVRVGTREDGSPDAPSRYFRTRQEARDYVSSVLRDRGAGVERRRTRYTLASWAEECLSLYGPTLQPYTLAGYRGKITLYLLPSPLARAKMEDVQRRDIQRWVNAMRKKDGTAPSPKTVRLAVGVLTWLFSRAVEADVIDRVPDTAHLRLPVATRPQRKVLQPADAAALLRASDGHRMHAALVVDACTGLRRSELLGLMWRDVDLTTGIYTIKHKVTIADGHPMLVDVLKTASASRMGQLPPEAIKTLRDHKRTLAAERLRAGELYTDRGLVFPDELGRVTHPQAFSAALRRLAQQAIGQDVGLHQFRHMVATALIRARLDDATIASALGHRSADFTRRQYADVYDDSRQAVAAVTGTLLENMK